MKSEQQPHQASQEFTDDMFSAAYAELYNIAARIKRKRGYKASQSPETLIHTAWIGLSQSPKLKFCSELHFKCIAARAMRHVLVDAARHRFRQKRGGKAVFVTLDESLEVAVSCDRDVLALDSALDGLSRMNQRQAELVEFHYWGDLTIDELVELRGLSRFTVLGELRAARAWLKSEMRRLQETSLGIS